MNKRKAGLLALLLFTVVAIIHFMDGQGWASFSDAMILAMVFPNMIGLLFLFPKVRQEMKRYLEAIKNSKNK